MRPDQGEQVREGRVGASKRSLQRRQLILQLGHFRLLLGNEGGELTAELTQRAVLIVENTLTHSSGDTHGAEEEKEEGVK